MTTADMIAFAMLSAWVLGIPLSVFLVALTTRPSYYSDWRDKVPHCCVWPAVIAYSACRAVLWLAGTAGEHLQRDIRTALTQRRSALSISNETGR